MRGTNRKLSHGGNNFFRKDRSNIEPVEETIEKREIDIMSRITSLMIRILALSQLVCIIRWLLFYQEHGAF